MKVSFAMTPDTAVVYGWGQFVQVESRIGELQKGAIMRAKELARICHKLDAEVERYNAFVKLRRYFVDEKSGSGCIYVHLILGNSALRQLAEIQEEQLERDLGLSIEAALEPLWLERYVLGNIQKAVQESEEMETVLIWITREVNLDSDHFTPNDSAYYGELEFRENYV